MRDHESTISWFLRWVCKGWMIDGIMHLWFFISNSITSSSRYHVCPLLTAETQGKSVVSSVIIGQKKSEKRTTILLSSSSWLIFLLLPGVRWFHQAKELPVSPGRSWRRRNRDRRGRSRAKKSANSISTCSEHLSARPCSVTDTKTFNTTCRLQLYCCKFIGIEEAKVNEPILLGKKTPLEMIHFFYELNKIKVTESMEQSRHLRQTPCFCSSFDFISSFSEDEEIRWNGWWLLLKVSESEVAWLSAKLEYSCKKSATMSDRQDEVRIVKYMCQK